MEFTRHAYRSIFTGLACAVLTGPAAAQHTDFVLFGEPDAEMNAVSEEQKFVHPLTSPYVNENSFITTGVRFWYVFHDFPNTGGAGIGGDAQVAAVQARLALTDRLQLVAYKDGYVWFNDSTVNDEGWNDIAAGLKYNFYRDIDNQLYMSGGVGYEFGWGDEEVLQGDDELRLWYSVDKGFDELHLGAVVNYFIPAGDRDGFGNSERLSWHLHADYYVNEWFSPVVEFNGYHTTDVRGGATVGFSGVDVANLAGGENEDVITMGVGAEFRVFDSLLDGAAIRAAYEFPLTDETDLFGSRITLSLAIDF